MVHYKLTYFDVRGLAEPSRQLFALAGVEYEDYRVELGGKEWESLKPTTPFGTVPVLEVDGFEIPESIAIARFLARRFGFAGKTDKEEAWVDAIIGQMKDFFVAFRQVIIAERTKKPVEEIERIKKEVFAPAKENYFNSLNKVLGKSKSGFLVGDGVTFADLFVVDNLTTLENLGYFKPSDQPKIAEYHKKVTSLPKLKEWIAKRPNTPI